LGVKLFFGYSQCGFDFVPGGFVGVFDKPVDFFLEFGQPLRPALPGSFLPRQVACPGLAPAGVQPYFHQAIVAVNLFLVSVSLVLGDFTAASVTLHNMPPLPARGG
jgi:hypothetical protein